MRVFTGAPGRDAPSHGLWPFCGGSRALSDLCGACSGRISVGGTPLPNEGRISVRIPPMVTNTPAARPVNPRFSSGPCAKPPTWSLEKLADATLGRSHRADIGKTKLKAAIDGTRDLLGVPADYRIGIVPASDTGAFEMAMWNLLGERPVHMVAWESFGAGWVTDAVKQLKIEAEVHTADYGHIVDMAALNYNNDVCFTWNGTTSGVRVPTGDVIPADRAGLTLCDATSAAFAQDLPWEKLDATTFSWQKVMGGEAAHGMLILSPRAVERLESYVPDWPLPKIFRLTKGGKLIDGIFSGATINTPSMLAVEDYLFALNWAREIGGLPALMARADANAQAIFDFVEATPWIENLAVDPRTRSNTSVCLKFTDRRITDGAGFAKAVARRLEAEGIALDIGAYRDAPPGLRIWCGATIETSDIRALLPWLSWAFDAEIAARSEAA
jgi:phosphoserine aminotransferase